MQHWLNTTSKESNQNKNNGNNITTKVIMIVMTMADDELGRCRASLVSPEQQAPRPREILLHGSFRCLS